MVEIQNSNTLIGGASTWKRKACFMWARVLAVVRRVRAPVLVLCREGTLLHGKHIIFSITRIFSFLLQYVSLFYWLNFFFCILWLGCFASIGISFANFIFSNSSLNTFLVILDALCPYHFCFEKNRLFLFQAVH